MNRTSCLVTAAVAGLLAAGCGEEERRWPRFTDVGAGLAAVAQPALAWGDYDSDGDLDLALAGYYWNGSPAYISRIYHNENGTFGEADAQLTGVRHGSLAWGDYDSDGDLDLALAGDTSDSLPAPVTKVYENDGGGNFTDVSPASLTGVYYCSLAWGDYDNDGDLDLAVAGDDGSGRTSKIYRNDGAGAFADIGVALMEVAYCSLAWGDYDNDGDLDLAIAGWPYSMSMVYRNDGGGVFTDIGAELPGISDGSVAWGDYDNDGHLDLVLAGGTVTRVFRGDGGGSFSDIGAELPLLTDCSLAWGDYDNDGDLDLAIAGLDSSAVPASKVCRNEGGGAFTPLDAGLEPVVECSLAWGDFDNDGDLDLALAGKKGVIKVNKIYRSDGGRFNWRPSSPKGLSAAIGAGEVTFNWDPASDPETPAPGLTYGLRVGTSPGKDDVMPSHAIIGGANDSRRLIPAMGNVQHNTSWTLTLSSGTYYWSVQAIDTAFAGSPWAPEETVTVP